MFPRILIAGSYGYRNTGDEAVLRVIVDQLRLRRPDAHLQLVTADLEAAYRQVGVDAIDSSDWAEVARAVRAADLVIVGGGSLFAEYERFDPRAILEREAPFLAHYVSFPILAGLYGKPLMLYAVGVGPLITDGAKKVVKLCFELANRVTVRDPESKRRLEELGIAPEKIEVTADPALNLEVAPQHRVKGILQNFVDLHRPIIGVVPRPWDVGIRQEDWEKPLVESLTAFASTIDGQILLIPFNPGFDDDLMARIYARMQGANVHLLSGNYSPSEVAGIVGRCDLVVGLRLHSLIFAALAPTPCIAIAYDPKVSSFMRVLHQEELCLDINDLSRLRHLLDYVWRKRSEIRASVEKAVPGLKQLATRSAEIACRILEEPTEIPPSDRVFGETLSKVFESRLHDIQAMEYELQKKEAELAIQKYELQKKEAELAIQKAEYNMVYHSKIWPIIEFYLRAAKRIRGLLNILGRRPS